MGTCDFLALKAKFFPLVKNVLGCKQARDVDSGLFLAWMCIYMYHHDKHWSFSIM